MALTSFSKLNISDYVYIVGIVVILLFAIAFITLAIFFFNAKKKTILHHIEDEEIQLEIEEDLKKIAKKNQSNENIIAHYSKKQKKSKVLSKILTGILTTLYIAVVALIGFSVSVKKNNQQMWFGNTAMLVIETDSMSQVYKGNTYLQEYGKMGDENRIAQYSFITITKERKYIDNIQPFDVVAFQMLSSDNKTYLTIVHRLIEITYDENGEPLYTFRGDANSRSMAGEFQIRKDKIVGVFETEGFKGTKNLALGYTICYLQSNIGMIILVIAFMLMLIYSILVEKLFSVYDQRYNELLATRLMQIENESKQEPALETIEEPIEEPVEDSNFEIDENASIEEIEEKIEEIAEENHIEKEKMMVKKGRIYYRDPYGRFMRLSDYLEMQKNGTFKKPSIKPSTKAKRVTPKKVGTSRPRDEYGRFIKIDDNEKLLRSKEKVGE